MKKEAIKYLKNIQLHCTCVPPAFVCLRYLGDKPLVLTQPRFSHGSLSVEASSELLQLLLTNQLCPQGKFTLMLRLLQTLPCLLRKYRNTDKPYYQKWGY